MIIDEQGLTPVQAAPTREPSGNAENYLAAAEGYSEKNYNTIDGRIDTQSKLTPGDDTDSQPEKQGEQKSSVLEKLKKKQAGLRSPEEATKPLRTRSNHAELE